MLNSAEEAGKTVTPGNIAYYAILHMKSGRRSQCASRTDAMSTGTIMDSTSSVLSVEEEVGVDDEFGGPITLGALLGTFDEDPAQAAARDLDWEEFFDAHDHRYGMIVSDIAEGRSLSETMKRTRQQRVFGLTSRILKCGQPKGCYWSGKEWDGSSLCW